MVLPGADHGAGGERQMLVEPVDRSLKEALAAIRKRRLEIAQRVSLLLKEEKSLRTGDTRKRS